MTPAVCTDVDFDSLTKRAKGIETIIANHVMYCIKPEHRPSNKISRCDRTSYRIIYTTL